MSGFFSSLSLPSSSLLPKLFRLGPGEPFSRATAAAAAAAWAAASVAALRRLRPVLHGSQYAITATSTPIRIAASRPISTERTGVSANDGSADVRSVVGLKVDGRIVASLEKKPN